MAGDILEGGDNGADEFVLAFVTHATPFSNWSAHQIKIWGKRFPTAEHAYQYRKFIDSDPDYALKISRAKSPWEARRLAWRQPIDPKTWDGRREAVMREILAAKLSQHVDVRQALKRTGGRAIVEKGNPEDDFWGIGLGNSGQNTLGKIWMSLRLED